MWQNSCMCEVETMLKFHRCTTLKGEVVFINLNKVLYFFEGRKGVVFVLDDGGSYEVTDSLDYVLHKFCELNLF